MYKCPLCTKTLKTPASLNHHIVTHTKEKPYKCLKCPAAFGLEASLKKHIQCVHNGIKIIKRKNSHCPMCSFTCSSKTGLDIHLRKHSAEQPFSCSVPNCGHKTKYKHGLQQHVRAVHSNEHSYECPADGCNYKATYIMNLKAHLKIHSNDRPFACEIPGCTFKCKRKLNLKRHSFGVHGDGQLAMKCSHCDFQTRYRSSLRTNQHTHSTSKRFQCPAPSCGFASSNKSTVEFHFDSKHRNKDIKCTETGCSRRYGSINLLKKHLKVHEHPISKCPAQSCNFSAKTKRTLLEHIRRRHTDLQSATEARPRKLGPQVSGTADAVDTILCRFPNCGYQTKFPHHLDRHRVTHKEEEKRNHVCIFCFHRFSSLSKMKYHVQTHTGEKPYTCSFCEYTTVSSFKLRYHAGKVHRIHVIPRWKEEEKRECHTCNMTLSSYTEFVLHSMTHLRPVVVLERLHTHVH